MELFEESTAADGREYGDSFSAAPAPAQARSNACSSQSPNLR